MTSKSELKRTAARDPVSAAERIYRMQDVITKLRAENAALLEERTLLTEGLHKTEAENAALRELLGQFAEFERDNTGYCEWCGTYPEQGHAADCIYPEVRAALKTKGHSQGTVFEPTPGQEKAMSGGKVRGISGPPDRERP